MENKDLFLEFDKKQFDIIKSWHNVSSNEDYSYINFFQIGLALMQYVMLYFIEMQLKKE